MITNETLDIKINSMFWNWFGKSMVVTNIGEPMILYHGTSSEDEFDIFMGDRGIAWFTPDKDYAERYMRDHGIIMTVFLSIENPYILKLSPQLEITLDDFIKSTGIKTTKKYFRQKYVDEKRPVWDWYDPSYTDFLDVLENLGYDGMQTIEYDKHVSWLPFDNSQIKSTKNCGRWNKNDDNIYN